MRSSIGVRGSRRRRKVAAGTAVLVASPIFGLAALRPAEISAFDTCGMGKWTGLSANAVIGSAIPTSWDTRIATAWQQWSQPNTGSLFIANPATRTVVSNPKINFFRNDIHSAPWNLPIGIPAFAEGATTNPHSFVNVRAASNNSNFFWGSTFDYVSMPRKVDIQTVFVHEVGHAMGLAHPEGTCDGPVTQAEQASTMYVDLTIKRTTTADDDAGAVFLYGK